MAERSQRVPWEQVSPTWWSSPVGYVVMEGGVWDAFVYRNQRTGAAWTERKPGFRSVTSAKRWVENEAEE
jgi:hypothetical protein